MSGMPNILLIGPLYKEERGNLGGATRSFGQLVDYFEAQGVPHKTIDTQRYNAPKLNMFDTWRCV